ncbi:MAG: hypothetical protein WC967_00040 [Balneolaceae bacterium]
MKKHTHTYMRKAFSFFSMLMLCGLFIGLTSSDVFAQVPPANQSIGNTASASYKDSGGLTRSATSNTVTTIVQQVAGLSITAGITKTVSPGNDIAFTHTITNTGNGTDNVTITAVDAGGGAFSYTNIRIYGDNGGAPDLGNEITSAVSVGGGNSTKVWIVASVPVSAIDGDSAAVTITATSGVTATTSATATDTGVVSEDAVINVVKSVNSNTAEVGDILTYTFTYSNTGNATGTNLIIRDELPSNVTYVANSARWSGTATALTDGAGGDPNGISYEYKSATTDSVVYAITSIASGNSGTVSFKVTVNAGSEGSTISNEGSYTHDDMTGSSSTGQVNVNIDEVYGIVVDGPAVITEGPVNQGSTVDFLNKFQNTGTATDNFAITYNGNTFPTGTQIIFYQTDGSGIATNPYSANTVTGVAPQAYIEVITRITLPVGATGGPFELTKTLTSANDPTKSASIKDSLTSITPASVDLTNDFAAGMTDALGEGQGPEGTVVQSKSANPATSVDFTLFIKNTSAIDDNYNLSTSTNPATNIADGSFTTLALPAGWTVVFKDPNNGNSIITTTGNIPHGTSKEVTATVNIPAGYAPGDVSLYFRVRSPNTKAFDVIHDEVKVNIDRKVTLNASQSSTIFPGGSKTFVHSFTVNSNVAENDGTNSNFEVTLSNSQSGYTAQVYVDVNDNGIQDAGDVLITSATSGAANFPAPVGTLNYGDVVKLIVKVTAPAGATVGDNNTTTLTITDTIGNVIAMTNTDLVTVQTGVLKITKSQSSDGGTTYSQANLTSLPGDIVYYKLVVENDGSGSLTDVDISDTTPAYTKMHVPATVSFTAGDFGAAGKAAPSITQNVAVGVNGTVKVFIEKLDASDDDVVIIFAIKINDN